mgnify:CR=1 FL=1
MRLKFTRGMSGDALSESLASCEETGDFLFVDFENTPYTTKPLLTKVSRESSGDIVLRSQTGCIFEVFARGKTEDEAITAYWKNCQEMIDSPRHVPD